MSVDIVGLSFLQFVGCLAAAGAWNAMFVILILALIEGGAANSAKKWPSAQGIIAEAIVISELQNDKDKSGALLYKPFVSYVYQVAGKEYNGTRLYFGSVVKAKTREQSEKKLSAYPPGAPVTVFYNPKAPDDAVLERESPRAGYLGRVALALLAFGVLALGLGIFLPNLFA